MLPTVELVYDVTVDVEFVYEGDIAEELPAEMAMLTGGAIVLLVVVPEVLVVVFGYEIGEVPEPTLASKVCLLPPIVKHLVLKTVPLAEE